MTEKDRIKLGEMKKQLLDINARFGFLEVSRLFKEKCRVLEGNDLVYVEIERPRRVQVSLPEMKKDEAIELGVMDVWKEYRTLKLDIDKLLVSCDMDVEEEKEIEVPAPINPMVRGGVNAGKLPPAPKKGRSVASK